MSHRPPTTSSLKRFAKLGGLAGRVGASMLGEKIAGFARSDLSQQIHQTEALVKNARRVAETLGELKGAAMKLGQMLSLHVGLMPPEVAEILKSLQRDAPRVPFEVMEYELKGQIDYDRLFARFEPEAFAAASIGQVHRAELADGRPVAVKLQYPAIDYIIKADLKNLRRLLQSLFSLFSNIDFEPLWQEVRDRLLEELDYAHEADNMRRMAALHAEVPEIVIPEVIDEASGRTVLTMEYVEGISPERAASDEFPQSLRDRWGQVLLEFQYRGLLEHRLMHADPNLANFSFLDDGRIIVYDFGCVKRIPEAIAIAYAALVQAVIAGDKAEIPRILFDVGVFKGESREAGSALPREVIDPYVDLFGEILRPAPSYTFGEDRDLYQKLIDLGTANWSQAQDLHFPHDVVFIDRSLAGHFGNLTKFQATGPWRELVGRYAAAV